MKKSLLLLASLSFLCFCLTYEAEAQRKPAKKRKKSGYTTRKPKDDPFLKSQWWLGFRAGANLTQANPDTRYSAFSPINYDADENQKEYGGFEKLGGHAGIEVTYYHRGFSFSFQPNYRRQRFIYSNDYLWEDLENAQNSVELNYEQDHQLDYIEFPLYVKYDLVSDGPFRPFIQVGGYYGVLTSANKSVEISGTDIASGNAGPFENQNVIVGAEDLFIKSSVGLTGGLGVSYDVQNVRLVFDISYRHGLNNITDTENRFSENQLSGIGDALDDISMQNIGATLGILFPLRYVTKNSKSFDAIN